MPVTYRFALQPDIPAIVALRVEMELQLHEPFIERNR